MPLSLNDPEDDDGIDVVASPQKAGPSPKQLKARLKRQAKKAVEQSMRSISDHPRCVPTTISGEEFNAKIEKGILFYQAKDRPPSFGFYIPSERNHLMKKIPFRSFNTTSRRWKIPISVESLKHLTTNFPGFFMEPRAFVEVLKLKRQFPLEMKLLDRIAELKDKERPAPNIEAQVPGRSLWDTQKRCVGVALEGWALDYGTMNLCEQGLGKTAMAITALNAYLRDLLTRCGTEEAEKFVALIIAPKGILFTTWVSEIYAWSDLLRPQVPLGTLAERGKSVRNLNLYDVAVETRVSGYPVHTFERRIGRPNVYLVNHEIGQTLRSKDDPESYNDLIIALRERLEEAGEHAIYICDEVDKLSNPENTRCKSIAYATATVSKRLTMTGTPGLPEKYRGVMMTTDRRIFNVSKTAFENRYVERLGHAEDGTIVGYRNIKELRRRLLQFGIRYRQEECPDIPKWSRSEIQVDMAPDQRRVYDQIAGNIETQYRDHDLTKINLSAKLHALRNICSGFVKDAEGEYVHFKTNPKLETMFRDMEDELVGDVDEPERVHKAFVVCQYREDLLAIERHLKALQARSSFWADRQAVYVHSKIKDGVKKKARTEAVMAFRHDPKTVLLVATEAAISHGHHLVPTLPQICDLGYIYSSGYVPNTRDQVVKRVIRRGQTRSVRFKEITCRDSIDETISDTIQERITITQIANGDNLQHILRGRRYRVS